MDKPIEHWWSKLKLSFTPVAEATTVLQSANPKEGIDASFPIYLTIPYSQITGAAWTRYPNFPWFYEK